MWVSADLRGAGQQDAEGLRKQEAQERKCRRRPRAPPAEGPAAAGKLGSAGSGASDSGPTVCVHSEGEKTDVRGAQRSRLEPERAGRPRLPSTRRRARDEVLGAVLGAAPETRRLRPLLMSCFSKPKPRFCGEAVSNTLCKCKLTYQRKGENKEKQGESQDGQMRDELARS